MRQTRQGCGRYDPQPKVPIVTVDVGECHYSRPGGVGFRVE